MKFIKIFILIFISLTSSVKADLDKNLVSELEDGGKLIFIRHAYAPGAVSYTHLTLPTITEV